MIYADHRLIMNELEIKVSNLLLTPIGSIEEARFFLYEKFKELLNSGYSKDDLLKTCKSLRVKINDECKRDLLIDMMEALTGWCAYMKF